MTRERWAAVFLLAAAIAAGTVSQSWRRRAPIVIGPYRVLAADFHVHTFPFNWTTLAPWDIVLEAERQSLDAVAIAGHNHVWLSQFARWCSARLGGPTVLVSEEVTSPRGYHLIAVGIRQTVDWNQSAAAAIAEVHRQGGVAIAAHPEKQFWRAFDADAMRQLDGAEVLHPDAYFQEELYSEMRQFYQRKPMTAIGSSDFHATGHPGLCRTYVFARENSSQAIVEALRARRTVVYDRDGRAYGDSELIQLAARDGRLPEPDLAGADVGFWAIFSRVAGLAGLIVAVLFRSVSR